MYLTFKKAITALSQVDNRPALFDLLWLVDNSYQNGKMTYQDQETIYRLVNNQFKRELIDG